MATLDLTPDELLTTTRAVRKRLDLVRSVDLSLVRECLEVAIQAPTGSNEQRWHFVVVTDAEIRAGLAALYRRTWTAYRNGPSFSALRVHADDPAMLPRQERMVSSVEYLAQNLERVPVHVIPCLDGRIERAGGVIGQASAFGSILPATWSFMLAARARGLGTAWTTLHLRYEEEAAELLGIPFHEVTQVALIPLAHVVGTAFRRAPRRPLDRALHVNRW